MSIAIDDSLRALRVAQQALTDAVDIGNDLPRFFAGGEIARFKAHVTSASDMLDLSAASMHSDAHAAAQELLSTSTGLRESLAAAQGRDGVVQLTGHLPDTRTAVQEFVNLVRFARSDGAWPTREGIDATLTAILRSPTARISGVELRVIADIADLPRVVRPDLPGAGQLRYLSTAADAATIRLNQLCDASFDGAIHDLNGVRGQLYIRTREDADAVLEELLARSEESLTSRELHHFDMLAQLPDAIRPEAFDGIPEHAFHGGMKIEPRHLEELARLRGALTWPAE